MSLYIEEMHEQLTLFVPFIMLIFFIGFLLKLLAGGFSRTDSLKGWAHEIRWSRDDDYVEYIRDSWLPAILKQRNFPVDEIIKELNYAYALTTDEVLTDLTNIERGEEIEQA